MQIPVRLVFGLVVSLWVLFGLFPATVSTHAFTLEERYEVSEFVHHQLQQAGFETNIRCTGTMLTIELVSASGNMDRTQVNWLVAHLTGIGLMLKRTQEVEDDFRLKFILGSGGYLISTVGRLDDFAQKLSERKATPKDLLETFELHRSGGENEERPGREEE